MRQFHHGPQRRLPEVRHLHRHHGAQLTAALYIRAAASVAVAIANETTEARGIGTHKRVSPLVDSIYYPALASAAVIVVIHVDNKSVVLTAQKIHCTISDAIDIEGVISKWNKAPSSHVSTCWIYIQSHSSYIIFVPGEVAIIETIGDLRYIMGEVKDVRPFLTLIGVGIAIGQVHADLTSVWITT
jgi:hypothetical protein